MEDAILVKNVSLEYQTITQNHSIRSMRFFSGKKDTNTVHALKDVSFSVKKGEILGIIGTNGSGKSTLLKTLAGVLAPNQGTINTFGQSISLLALGVGFSPDLSGRDNIFLSGLLMGFSEDEIQKEYDNIVNFSELGKAINRPVKTYSSGMHSKLAFSIAVTLRTDIILVDEVLAVGDVRFRQKSHKKMEELIRDRNTTVIIVSHNMNEIQQLCNRVMWLDQGIVRAVGPTDRILKAFQDELKNNPAYLTELPTTVTTATAANGEIQISWAAIEHATDYRVYRKEVSPTGRWESIRDAYYDTKYTDVPPSATQSYIYAVRARAVTENSIIWSEFIPSKPVKLLTTT